MSSGAQALMVHCCVFYLYIAHHLQRDGDKVRKSDKSINMMNRSGGWRDKEMK